MAMSDPRTIFGVHGVTAYGRTDGLPYGPMLRVLEGSSISMSSDLIELMGGSSKFSWAAEDGQIKAEMDLKADEFPDYMFQLFLGKAPTAVNTPDTSGTITSGTNKKGTSVIAATGLVGVTIKTAAKTDLKFGKYVIKAVDTTHVDVYLLSDVDIARGNAGTVQDDFMKITASTLSISTGATVDIPNFGLTLTGGASATAFTAGDTATFEVLPPATKSMSVVIGGQASSFPEFGSLALAQKRGNQEMFEIDCYRCKAAGFPLDLAKTAWAKAAVKIKLLYDSSLDGVFKIRHISPS
jgi:hypothetical protein